MSEEPVLFETEGGFVVLRGGEVLFSHKKGSRSRRENLVRIAERGKAWGLGSVKVPDQEAAEELGKFGMKTEMLSAEEKEELNSQRLSIMVKAGFAADEPAALSIVRENAMLAAKEQITETSSREDLQLVHGIQGLDEIDKFLNVTSERVTEWYGLHFPELQAMLGDNVLLCKLVVEIGPRAKFDEESLQGKGFSEKKIEALVVAAKESNGGTVTERDVNRIAGLAQVALASAAEREKLAEYVESTMKRIAPNMTDVAGATIGARLIAKAGGLDRIARLPASTIQVLGAEKALFRALRTGSRPPKHGILFQHEAVHTAPKWQRGKIARALANKIAIAARIDYYRGEKEGGLTGTLEKRLDEIRIKYKEPTRTEAPKRSFRDDKYSRFGKGRKERGSYRETSPGARIYGEDLVKIEGEEFRAWDPFRSKLAGAIIKGLPEDIIAEGDKVLYLGTSTGTTPSHVSDVVGEKGLLIGVESSMRVGREFVEKVAKARKNVVPYIADRRDSERFGALGKVDVVYCDIAQPDQTEIAIANCRSNLKKGGRLLLVVKARSIDVIKNPREVFLAEKKRLETSGFEVEKLIELSPFDKDHAIISAKFVG